MWRNASTPTCYEQMVPITVTQLGRGYIVGKERVISKVNRTFDAPTTQAPRPATVYLYEYGMLASTKQVETPRVDIALEGVGQQMAIVAW